MGALTFELLAHQLGNPGRAASDESAKHPEASGVHLYGMRTGGRLEMQCSSQGGTCERMQEQEPMLSQIHIVFSKSSWMLPLADLTGGPLFS